MQDSVFPNFRDMQLTDKGLINWYFHTYPPVISEYTFTNLFTWRSKYRFKICILKDCLCILAEPAEGAPYLLPPVGERESLKRCLNALYSIVKENGLGWEMHRVPEEFIIHYVVEGVCYN